MRIMDKAYRINSENETMNQQNPDQNQHCFLPYLLLKLEVHITILEKSISTLLKKKTTHNLKQLHPKTLHQF